MGWITTYKLSSARGPFAQKKMAVKKISQDLYTLIQATLLGLDSVIDENTENETGKERRKFISLLAKKTL
jgi:hypothetical protein